MDTNINEQCEDQLNEVDLDNVLADNEMNLDEIAVVENNNDVINYPYESLKGKKKIGIIKKFIKRSFDFCSSLCLFIVLNVLLIFPILAVVTAVKMKGNPFFVQKRPGRNGKIFRLIKFRTMTNEKDSEGNLLPDDIRLTKFGKMLRDTSLDELPELINIICGKMSVVGPRPQLVRDMAFFSDDAMCRQSVRPGLTGLAQIKGRNNISWEEKFDFDLEYLDKMGLIFDLKVIFGTISKVLHSDDVATDGMETAEDYGDYLLRIGAATEDEYQDKQQLAKSLGIKANRKAYVKQIKVSLKSHKK